MRIRTKSDVMAISYNSSTDAQNVNKNHFGSTCFFYLQENASYLIAKLVALPSPGVRIVVASPVFPKKSYRGRKETGRAVLFT